ncbi:uncharacterized protein LOC108677995 [Hyalella azteca]|uniref:Uncharacterized protein LOC108677995 n=1 Tax=Hyalella azteca TaxID=294128 RepID=A0A8B7P6Y5_HYAAZ|nr:uncharacterized protein LOC108677995 [Hyalella azteca]XP_047736412.1 uncharacterized protein LOC108677995 [Hyalella azteca]
MATLTGDVRVWSLREDVVVRDADFSAVRYQDKTAVRKERIYYEEKKRYIEARGGCAAPKNSRPTRLRDAIKEFEELLGAEQVVWSSWGATSTEFATPSDDAHEALAQHHEPCRVYYMVLASGVVCTALLSAVSGDLRGLTSDKYMTGKLLSEHPAHAAITSNHLVITYNDSRVSVLHMDAYTPPCALPLPLSQTGDSTTGYTAPLFSSRHPALYTAQLAGPHGRRFQRKISANSTGDMIAVWWERSEDEVYPWSPLERDCRDRANILIYGLRCGQLSLFGHARSHLPPLSVAFSARDANVLLSVEQGFDKKGGVSVLSVVYKVGDSKVERVSVTTIPLEAPVASHSYSPKEDRLFLACNNGVLALHSHASTHLTRAALSPTHVTWLQPGALLAVANDRGQVQFFDMALSLVRVQLGGEDGLPLRLLDFADYFCHQPSLRDISWAPAPVVFSCSDTKRNYNANVKRYLDVREQHSSLLLVLQYVRGPLLCIRFNAPHFSLTHPVSNPRLDDLSFSSSLSPNTEDSDSHNTSQISYGTTTSNSSGSIATKSSVNNQNSSQNTTGNSSGHASKDDQGLTAHYCSICPDVLVGEYLRHGQVEEAINLSRSLCWEQDGGAALKCISSVVNYIIRRGQISRPSNSVTPHSPAQDDGQDRTSALTVPSLNSSPGLWETRILNAAAVLSSGFLSPSAHLTPATEELYGPPVRALARRLFFKLLRSACLQSAFSLAQDLGDPDCFVRLHRSAERAGLPQLAAQSLRHANSLRSSSTSSCSGSCSHSGSSYSGSSSGSSCCDEDCSHSSCTDGSTSSSGSESCSTCSDSSSDSDSHEGLEERGERQGGDGRESEGPGSSQHDGVSRTPDDARAIPDRPLFVQQPTSVPPPVPAPILPRDSNISSVEAVASSTMTYYDPPPYTSHNFTRTASVINPSGTSNDVTEFTSNSGTLKAANVPKPENVIRGLKPTLSHTTVLKNSTKSSQLHDMNFKIDLKDDLQTTRAVPTTQYNDAYVPSSAHQLVANQYSNSRNVTVLNTQSNAMRHYGPLENSGTSSDQTGDPYSKSSGNPVSAITSMDGKVTINITQNESLINVHRNTKRSSHRKSKTNSRKRNESSSVSEEFFLENKSAVSEHRHSGKEIEVCHFEHSHVAAPKSRHDKKKQEVNIPFKNRRSQRNLTDAMDAADSAIAALHSVRKSMANEPDLKAVPTTVGSNVFQNSDPKNHTLSIAESSQNTTGASHNLALRTLQSVPNTFEKSSFVPKETLPMDVGYYNEDTIDEEMNRSLYQDLSTEEEEGGGTVKVVHFGVV